MPPPPNLLRQWLLTLLLGSAAYAAYHGVVHFSDWCYLGVSSLCAGAASAAVVPLNGRLLRYLAGPGRRWPRAGRGAALLLGTLVLFGLANALVLPLRSWPGPYGTWPWGGAALLMALAANGPLLRPRPAGQR